ncbi:MAG: tetratricopeptide repeat protein [Bacteroidales bacterium]
MKRSERHHLKENELALSVARAREQFDTYQKQIIASVLLVVLVIAVVGGFFWWRQRTDNQSRTMLLEAMTVAEAQVVPPPAPPAPGQTATPAANTPPPPGSYPSEQAKLSAALPKFIAAANAYPSTKSGIAARYHAASCLVALGRTKEAIDQYRQVIDRAGNDLYGDMARLGLAEAEVEAGQYESAINAYRELATKATLPTDAILMQMGRAYAKAGKKTEARQSFQRILDEFPQSQYAQSAKKELDEVKG